MMIEKKHLFDRYSVLSSPQFQFVSGSSKETLPIMIAVLTTILICKRIEQKHS
jgi:hypothetical protein